MDRGTHGPMDFEYQNGTGPLDGRSPFANIGTKQQRPAINGSDNSAKKRSWSVFGSPSKPVVPGLRDPASQQYLFSQPALPPPSPSKRLPDLPSPQRKDPRFFTPRKLDIDLASSGGETPKSPEREVDSDATPDMGPRGAVSRFDTASMPTFTAGNNGAVATLKRDKDKDKDRRRDSWWNRAAGLINSPGRGELARGDKSVYSDKIVKRVRRKRSRDMHRQLARARNDSISESELDDDSRSVHGRKASGKTHNESSQGQAGNEGGGGQAKPHFWYTLLDFLTTHPTLPHILSFYAQLLLNLFLVLGIIYAVWSFWATVRSDVDKKSSEAVAELLAEMAVCAQQYTANRCERASRVPAMEVVCTNWEKCMSRDPRSVGRARVSAHTFAEIFNSFIEPISYKAMIFTVLLVFSCVAMSNFAFSIFRDKAAAHAAANHHHYYGANAMPPPPPTPQRQFSGPQDGFWTPYHHQPALDPAPSAAFGEQIEGQSSPVRRLQFH